MPLKIIRQDITKIKCDAIVNPTNEDLFPGGGVDLAIHSAAGEGLLEACRELGGLRIGQAKITPAFSLPAKFVIHTAGHLWQGGERGERELLESCYKESLALAKANGCESVAFPLISSGLYGYPKDKVLRVAMDVIGEFLFENEMTVYIVVFDKTSYAISEKLFSDVTSFIDDFYTEVNLPLFDSIREERSYTEYCRKTAQNKKKEQLIDENSSKVVPQRPWWKKKTEVSEVDDDDEVYYGSLYDKNDASFEEKSKNASIAPISLDDMLSSMDKGFAETLFYYIDQKGISDVECYKRANVDKKTFSKIKCNKSYKPSKITALSFAIALRLNLEETGHLLNTVGFSLSRSSKFDVIIEYFITTGNYRDIYDVNETLYQFDQSMLGA